MEALIPVNYDGDRPTVSGRELHLELGVKTLYKDWFPRMCEYGFEEGRDFNPLKNEQVRQEGDRMVTRVIEDHQLTLNMAKEIAMIQRNEAGKRIRLYLIQVEEAWNSPEQVMARALAIANRELAAFKATVCGLQEKTAVQEEKINALEGTVEEQDRLLKEYQPKAHYVDTILSSRDALRTTQIAADYGLSARQLNDILHEAGLQYKCNRQWILYRKFAGKGYVKSGTVYKLTKSGKPPRTAVYTSWTQKGRLLIHEILQQRNIIPVMDREIWEAS